MMRTPMFVSAMISPRVRTRHVTDSGSSPIVVFRINAIVSRTATAPSTRAAKFILSPAILSSPSSQA